ncbi:MAG: hypothetical protein J6R32_06360 [Bacteroidales bacterium]|nr:hypothetical protein [Bacteroidales bacterium]
MSIKDLFISPKIKGIVAISAAVVMYFTPDEVDHIIEGLLSVFGISTLVIGEKEEKK